MKKTKLRLTFNAPVVLGFAALCLVVLIAGLISKGASTRLLFSTYRSSLLNPLTYVRFLTHVAGHSGWEHFLGNMAYILLLGPMLEEKYGSLKLLIMMAICAVITGVINYILFPNISLCGASGIVFAFILLTSITSFREGEISLTFILVAVIYLGQQVYQAIFVRDNVSNLSHIIGGIVGGGFGYLMNRKPKKKE